MSWIPKTAERQLHDERQEVACLLPPAEMEQRIGSAVAEVLAGVTDFSELEDGYALQFPGEADWFGKLTDFIAVERECCGFLQFELILEPALGPITLRLRGTPDARAFMGRIFEGFA